MSSAMNGVGQIGACDRLDRFGLLRSGQVLPTWWFQGYWARSWRGHGWKDSRRARESGSRSWITIECIIEQVFPLSNGLTEEILILQ